MRNRTPLFLTVAGIMAAAVVLGARSTGDLPSREWARKASGQVPATAILLEFGLDDEKPTPWSGRAKVSGARVVHREGYRFHEKDRLVELDAWTISSHRPFRLPKGQPALTALEGLATVGVVLHLAELTPDAVLAVHADKEERPAAEIPLKQLLAGKEHKFWNGRARARLLTTARPLAMDKTEDDAPTAAYGPDGSLWVAHVAYHVREEERRIEPPKLQEQPRDFGKYFTPEFGDQVLLTRIRNGKAEPPLAVTGPREDIARCALAAEGDGTIWVIYAAHRRGKHLVCARPLRGKGAEESDLGPEEVLPGQDRTERNLSPAACTDSEGRPVVVWQSWTERGARPIGCRRGEGAWETLRFEGDFAGNCWHLALAAGGDHRIALGCDRYGPGDYDILVSQGTGTKIGPASPAAGTSAFEARPSLAYDSQGRLWIAYEEGPEQWGKDFGALDDQEGNPLYFQRRVQVLCLVDGKVFRPAATLPTMAKRSASPASGAQAEAMPRYAYPKIGFDGKGRIWLTYRVKFGTRYSTHPGPYWLTFARRLDGDHWTEPIEVHHSDGLLDDRPVLLPHPAGGLLIVHNTDGRYTTPTVLDNQIYLSHLDLPGDPQEPKLAPWSGKKKPASLLERAQREKAAVERIRKHRVRTGGNEYRLLRGEFHRHTELSWDGGPDGSLEDMFRYALDAAELDWIGNGDHDNGAGREYSWWLTQKYTDAYHVPGLFTPVFSYERSVSYPHGHRNCIFVQRGVRTLPRLAEADPKKRVAGIHADDTKMFYRYLHQFGGICAVHTSATGMGTDWRDNDPVVEPIVEIYQGDRMSYEKEAAPRAGFDPRGGKKPANIGGWYPKGYIDLALQRGYKLGFQSSSDHFSTHISYCIVLAETQDRAGIVGGLKNRRCYGATDDIILDVRSGKHLMGAEFTTDRAPTLDLYVHGTADLARVEILKDSVVVRTFTPNQAKFEGNWTDPNPDGAAHYYYVRVVQTDGEIAWGSPFWITKK